MKVLFISPYTTYDSVPLLSQCKAGFGYMVYDIAKTIAVDEEVHMLLINYQYKSFKSDNIHFIEATFWNFIKYMFSCSSITIPIQLRIKYKMRFRTLIRIVYMWMISGYYYKVISNGGYDIVHIHGCNFNDEILIDICKRAKVPFLFTLHGLNSFSEEVSLESAGKQYERDFLERVTLGEFPITVISSGIRKTIENEYGKVNDNFVSVVCNSFSFIDAGSSKLPLNIKQIYNIPEDANLILYVGNISRNKNQEQMVRAFEFMSKELQEKTYVLFCGRNIEVSYKFDNIVQQSQYKDHLLICGNIIKEEMPAYYKHADGIVLLSFSEGFGLSLIEGMHFGKPCLTFDNLDAYEDIYDACAVIGIKERTDTAVAEGLELLLTQRWNSREIIGYSKKFESSTMKRRYIEVYKQTIA